MPDWWWWVPVIVAICLVGLYLSITAGRLDRLHRRIETSRYALDLQLLRRSALALDLASAGIFAPATTVVLADAAHVARVASDDDLVMRGLAESDLTRVFVAAIPD